MVSDLCNFTRNPHEQFQKQLEIYLQTSREFGAIPDTCLNPQCPKPWAIAQAFCSKSVNFGPLQIRSNSTRTFPQTVINPFTSLYAAFQGVWSDPGTYQNPPLFAQNRSISDPCEFTRNPHEQSPKQFETICKHVGGVSGGLERFPALTKIRHVQNPGL